MLGREDDERKVDPPPLLLLLRGQEMLRQERESHLLSRPRSPPLILNPLRGGRIPLQGATLARRG